MTDKRLIAARIPIAVLTAFFLLLAIFGGATLVAEWGASSGALISGAVIFSSATILAISFPFSFVGLAAIALCGVWLRRKARKQPNGKAGIAWGIYRKTSILIGRFFLFFLVLGTGSFGLLADIWIARGFLIAWAIVLVAFKKIDGIRKMGFTALARMSFAVLALAGIVSLMMAAWSGHKASPSELPVQVFPLATEEQAGFSRIYDVAVRSEDQILFDDRLSGNLAGVTYPGYADPPIFHAQPILTSPERIMIASDGTIFVFCKGKDFGLFRVSPNLDRAEKMFRYFAVDAEIDPERGIIILVGEREPDISIFNLVDNKVRRHKLPVFMAPYAIAISRKEKAAFISGWFFSSNLIKATIDSGLNPEYFFRIVGPFSMGMAVDDVRGQLYLARPLIGKIDVFRTEDLSRVDRIDAPMWLREIALNEDKSLLFAPNYLTGEMAVIRTDDGARCASYRVGSRPRAVVYSAPHKAVLVANASHITALPLSKLPSECFMRYKR